MKNRHISAFEMIEQIALSLPAASQNIKWELVCFVICEKIFMICDIEQAPVSACFKIDKNDFNEYLESDNFVQAPHMAKGQWIMAKNIALIDEGKWKQIIEKSYNLVVAKLTKTLQKQILESIKKQENEK